MTARPHDALFKSAFESPDGARELLRELLPPELSDAIAWEKLTPETGSYVDPKLADSHSDLLFSMRLRDGHDDLVYALLEHQSTRDPTMPLRALEYHLRIWRRFRKDKRDARLPPIITVIVSHVPGGWTTARSFEELFEPDVLDIPALAALVPRFSLIIDDLAQLSDDELKARSLAPYPKLALWLLRDARDPDRLLDSFDTWISTMLQLSRSRSGREAFFTLIGYMFRVVGPMKADDLRAKVAHMSDADAEEAFYSYADYLEDKGREKGRLEGRQKGHLEGCVATLRILLLQRFSLPSLDPSYEARLQAASPEAIVRIVKRALTADSIAAVFED
jgi:predicted transposase/invertase (TIGR01784 family)